MTEKTDGGPAFPKPRDPFPNCDDTPYPSNASGMSLRDWFAGHVASGLAAYPGNVREGNEPKHFALWAYAVADAMLAERDRK